MTGSSLEGRGFVGEKEFSGIKKVWFVCAHDCDAVLGAGGSILRHLANGDSVYVTICYDGRTSHWYSFNEKDERPTLAEVGNARRKEIHLAMDLLGVEVCEILDLPNDDGRPIRNWDELGIILRQKIKVIQPDLIYFNDFGAHPDHTAVNAGVRSAIKDFHADALMFRIWMDDYAFEKNSQRKIHVLTLTESETDLKRRALDFMRSQIRTQPYPNWDPQPRAILEASFIEYFLRGKEIFIPA